jgi:hypothetical protein
LAAVYDAAVAAEPFSRFHADRKTHIQFAFLLRALKRDSSTPHSLEMHVSIKRRI